MADLRELKDKAAELAARGKLPKAVEAYREVLRADPGDVASRQRLGELRRKLGDGAGAIAEYRPAADAYAREGLLIKAIAVCKVILEIDPEHADTQQMLADLYARKRSGAAAGPPGLLAAAPRVVPAAAPEAEPEGRVELPLPVTSPPARGPPILAAPSPDSDAADLPPELDPSLAAEAAEEESTAFEIILGAAHQARELGVEEEAVLETDEPLPEPPRQAAPGPGPPRIPLFSDLSPAAFRALTERLALRRVEQGEIVLRQGEPGDRFYVIASGQFRVEKRDEGGESLVLAHLGEGTFFGEMALLSGSPRAASVVAERPGELLELRAAVLADLCRRHPHVADSLTRFYRQRLLANAMATSPLFRPFGAAERTAIMERFRAREVTAGERVIREGQPSDGLYVVLSGSSDVVKRHAAGEIPVGALREGDVFGEMSCLRKTPATATVVVRRAGTLLRLPRADFDEMVLTYPQILELVSDLTDERQLSLEAIVAGRAEWTEDGLLLI